MLDGRRDVPTHVAAVIHESMVPLAKASRLLGNNFPRRPRALVLKDNPNPTRGDIPAYPSVAEYACLCLDRPLDEIPQVLDYAVCLKSF